MRNRSPNNERTIPDPFLSPERTQQVSLRQNPRRDDQSDPRCVFGLAHVATPCAPPDAYFFPVQRFLASPSLPHPQNERFKESHSSLVG